MIVKINELQDFHGSENELQDFHGSEN